MAFPFSLKNRSPKSRKSKHPSRKHAKVFFTGRRQQRLSKLERRDAVDFLERKRWRGPLVHPCSLEDRPKAETGYQGFGTIVRLRYVDIDGRSRGMACRGLEKLDRNFRRFREEGADFEPGLAFSDRAIALHLTLPEEGERLAAIGSQPGLQKGSSFRGKVLSVVCDDGVDQVWPDDLDLWAGERWRGGDGNRITHVSVRENEAGLGVVRLLRDDTVKSHHTAVEMPEPRLPNRDPIAVSAMLRLDDIEAQKSEIVRVANDRDAGNR